MFSSLLKKKISANTMANVFINGLMEVLDESYPFFVEIINDDPAFVSNPNLGAAHREVFDTVVFATNLQSIAATFDPEDASEVYGLVIQKLAPYFEVQPQELEKRMLDCQGFIKKVNRPSRNWVYGMSKALFAKYELHNYQDEYFKRLASPNPLFLKRMDEIMQLFIWDWDAFFKRYKL